MTMTLVKDACVESDVTKPKYTPLYERVLVLPDERDTVSPGGIVLHQLIKEAATTGTVIAVGQGKLLANGQLHKCMLQVGARVIYSKYSGAEVDGDGDAKLRIIKEEDILGVINE